MLVQNWSKIGRNWSGVVPNAPETLLGHTRPKPISLRKLKKAIKCWHVWKPFVFENSIWKSRPHMAPQADPQRAKCSSIDPLSYIFSSKTRFSRSTTLLLPGVFDLKPSFSWKHIFSFGAVWICFLEGSIRGTSGGDPGESGGRGRAAGDRGGLPGKAYQGLLHFCMCVSYVVVFG